MRLIAGGLCLCLLSACYGLQPQVAERLDVPESTVHLPAGARLALLTTDGSRLSPQGPPWQQAGLVRLHELLQAQGLKLAELAPASEATDLLAQGFPELAGPDPVTRLARTAEQQQADLIVLLKQVPRQDIRVDMLTRQMRYSCEVDLQVYSPAEQRYLFQIRARGENGYAGLMQSAGLLGILTATVATPAIRLGFGANQQQGTQVSNIVQLAAGVAIVSMLAWDVSQGIVPAETRQQQACEQALQQAASGLAKEMQLPAAGS